MIDEHLNEQLDAFKLKSSVFETLNNDQQFLVIDMIIAFSENHAFAVESYRMKNSLIIIL
jgi:hypothetical protein